LKLGWLSKSFTASKKQGALRSDAEGAFHFVDAFHVGSVGRKPNLPIFGDISTHQNDWCPSTMVNGRSRPRPSAARSQHSAPKGTPSKTMGADASAIAIRFPIDFHPLGADQINNS
jgi:hypothetical protein